MIHNLADLNHLTTFIILVVVGIYKKKKKKKKKNALQAKNDRVASRANTQSSSEYFSIRMYVESWRVEINNIIRLVKYEYMMSTSDFEYK